MSAHCFSLPHTQIRDNTHSLNLIFLNLMSDLRVQFTITIIIETIIFLIFLNIVSKQSGVQLKHEHFFSFLSQIQIKYKTHYKMSNIFLDSFCNM